MTIPIFPESTQQDLEGRSVRDVVAYSHDQVTDAWCRKVWRKILRSLALQYAMQMPHRVITPDTVVFHANGEPLLISDDIDAAPAPDDQLAGDLTALAGVIHYAITQESTPAGPLDGRVDGYSAALVATVDACMDPDPARRPRSIDAVCGLLGIAAPAPLAGALTLPEVPAPREAGPAAVMAADSVPAAPILAPPMPVPAPAPPSAPAARGMPEPDAAGEAPYPAARRRRRWAYGAVGGAIALALVVFASLRDRAPDGHDVLAQQQAVERARPAMAAQTGQAVVGAPASAPDSARELAGEPAADPVGNRASDPVGSTAVGASTAGATGSGGEVEQPGDATRTAVDAAASAAPAVSPRAAAAKTTKKAKADAAAGARAAPGTAIYQLQIKPWGMVYVDGVERGASPPMKRLALTPGPHTIRVTHPKHRDSILEFESAPTTSNGKIIIDFNQEAQ